MERRNSRNRSPRLRWTRVKPTRAWRAVRGRCIAVVMYESGIYLPMLAVKERGSNRRLHIHLPAAEKATDARSAAAAWILDFETNGTPSPEETLRRCFLWKTICRTRADALDTLFFSISGYEWLDGGLVHTGPEDPDEEGFAAHQAAQREQELADMEPEQAARRRKDWAERDAEIAAMPYGPMSDPGGPRGFYPCSTDYSNLAKVPDDVRPEWLALAYEAAGMLRDRSGPAPDDPHDDVETRLKTLLPVHRLLTKKSPSAIRRSLRPKLVKDRDEQRRLHLANRKFGERAVKELERRFPQLKKD